MTEIEIYKKKLEDDKTNTTASNRKFDAPPFPPFKNKKTHKE